MGFFSAVKKFFTGGSSEKKQEKPVEEVKVEAVAKAEESAPAEASAEAPAEDVEDVPAAPEQPAPSATAIPVEKPVAAPAAPSADPEEEALALALRQAEPKLSAWLAVVLEGVEEADALLWKRLGFPLLNYPRRDKLLNRRVITCRYSYHQQRSYMR